MAQPKSPPAFDEKAPIACAGCKAQWPNNAAFCEAQERKDMWELQCPACGGSIDSGAPA